MRKGQHVSHMENRYHKVMGLDPVLNWSRKNVVGLGPSLNWSTLAQNSRINYWNQNSRIPCKSASSFNIFGKHNPTLGGQWEQSSFLWFSQKLRVNCRMCVVVDKTRATYGHGLMDLRTYLQYTDCITKYGPIIHGSLDKPRTYNSRIWQTKDLLFTDLTNQGSIIHGLDKARTVI